MNEQRLIAAIRPSAERAVRSAGVGQSSVEAGEHRLPGALGQWWCGTSAFITGLCGRPPGSR